jgi:UDP-N-acetylglucosamine acyltransferase
MIHPTAIISPQAELGSGVRIGAYSLIGEGVRIGDHCEISSHVVIEGNTVLGVGNRVFSFACLGGEPQHKRYKNEATRLEIGDHNVIREYVTIHRGTALDQGLTRVGSHNWIMAYCHIAHDCQVGDHTVFANNASLAGHVQVGNHVILGGFTGVHQFSRVGDHAFTGMGTMANRDIPPFVIAVGNYAKPYGINKEGLRRRSFSSERIQALHQAFKILIYKNLPRSAALEAVAALAQAYPEVKQLVDFIQQSKRGIIR